MSSLGEFSNELAAAVEKAGASTVLVDGRRRYPASGIAYAADLVLTADHVLTREDNINVSAADGKVMTAALAGRDAGSDLALLRLAERSLTPARTAEALPKVGSLVLAIGRPSKAGLQASWGIVRAVGGPTRTGRGGMLEQYIQTETISYPGFSGGPLANSEGLVLGLNTSGLTHGGALTIPTKTAWRIAEALAKHGTVKRGYLGVRTQAVSIPESGQKALARQQEHGLLILWLEEKGPAEAGGLLVGDILVAVEGQAVEDPDDLFAALGSDTVGRPVQVEVLRGGQPVRVAVTVTERQ